MGSLIITIGGAARVVCPRGQLRLARGAGQSGRRREAVITAPSGRAARRAALTPTDDVVPPRKNFPLKNDRSAGDALATEPPDRQRREDNRR